MNKLTKKATAIGLTAALCIGGTGMVFAQTGNEAVLLASSNSQTEAKVSQSTDVDSVKDETVYVLAGADGMVKKIIVSDWIKNTSGSSDISDKSGLSNIENVKGDEGYTINADNMVVWDAGGNDIYYQGNTDKELPVGLTVSYMLDGKSISAGELAGKSGKVSIRFDYENRQYETVKINGSDEKIYVPFAMLTGMILDSDNFRNVEVSNGKLINDGNNTIVIGLVFPGLKENIGLESDEFDIPDYVEITADVSDFEFGMTVTVATNEIFSKIDTTKLDSLDGVADSLGELTAGMDKLYDGLCTLLDKSDELVSGVNKLADGAKEIMDGADSLDEGAVQLSAGLSELKTGLGALSSNSTAINAGAGQVFNTLLSTAAAQLNAAGIEAPALTIGNYADVLCQVIDSLEKMAAYSEEYAVAAKTVMALKESLDNYNTFYQGLCVYTNGVDSAAAGAESLMAGSLALKEGTAKLKAGAAVLYSGVLTLKDGMPALTEGITALKDGSMELSEGLKTFNEQGIQKITELASGDLENTMARLKATIDVSEDYYNFTGISDDMSGQVKFIYRTDEISAD